MSHKRRPSPNNLCADRGVDAGGDTCMHLRWPTHSAALSHSTNSSVPSVHILRSLWSSQKPQM